MKKYSVDEFLVAGLSGRVRNDDPAAIGSLWEAFRSRDLRAEIGDTASQDVYCIYHNYDGGFSDPFQMTIGYRVPAEINLPSSMHCTKVPAQNVVAFSAEGSQPNTLISQWQAIWQSDLDRAYLADYDVYDAKNSNLVTVHVGLATS